MDLTLFKRRRRLGILCAICCVVVFIALIDALLARFRQNPHEFHVLPESKIDVMGPLPQDIKDLSHLKVTISPDDGIGFSFMGTQSGYWLGGTFWRAAIEVPKKIPEGKYVVTVTGPPPYDKKPLARFTISVHGDPEGIRKASLSLFKRYLSINPWFVFSSSFVCALCLGAGLFLLSSRIEKLLRNEGIGEVYRILFDQEKSQTYLLFGIGRNVGLTEKDLLEIIDLDGKIIGTAEIKELYERDGVGLLLECKIKPSPGLLVRKKLS